MPTSAPVLIPNTLSDEAIYSWMENYAVTKMLKGIRTRVDKGRARGYKKVSLTHDELDILMSQIWSP